MEIWRDVPDYIGLYQVSDDGNVRSLKRLSNAATAEGIRTTKHLLKIGSNNKGRLQVTLCKLGVTRRFLLHRLVLAAFAGPCPEGYEGLFKSGDVTDCKISNLHWGIRTARDAGETSPRAKLAEQDVRDIHHIKTRVTWKHI